MFANGHVAVGGAGGKALGPGPDLDDNLTEMTGNDVGCDTGQLADYIKCQGSTAFSTTPPSARSYVRSSGAGNGARGVGDHTVSAPRKIGAPSNVT